MPEEEHNGPGPGGVAAPIADRELAESTAAVHRGPGHAEGSLVDEEVLAVRGGGRWDDPITDWNNDE